jgi:hypothetical protein
MGVAGSCRRILSAAVVVMAVVAGASGPTTGMGYRLGGLQAGGSWVDALFVGSGAIFVGSGGGQRRSALVPERVGSPTAGRLATTAEPLAWTVEQLAWIVERLA